MPGHVQSVVLTIDRTLPASNLMDCPAGHAGIKMTTQYGSSVGISDAAVGTIHLIVNRDIKKRHRPVTQHELFSRTYFNDFRFTIVFHGVSPSLKRRARPSPDCRSGDEQNLVCIQPRRFRIWQPDTPQVKIDNSIDRQSTSAMLALGRVS